MNQIREILKGKGISQAWFSKQMEKSYTTINKYTQNVRPPSLEDLYRITKILNISVPKIY